MREKSKFIVDLLENSEKLNKERNEAMKVAERIAGISSHPTNNSNNQSKTKGSSPNQNKKAAPNNTNNINSGNTSQLQKESNSFKSFENSGNQPKQNDFKDFNGFGEFSSENKDLWAQNKKNIENEWIDWSKQDPNLNEVKKKAEKNDVNDIFGSFEAKKDDNNKNNNNPFAENNEKKSVGNNFAQINQISKEKTFSFDTNIKPSFPKAKAPIDRKTTFEFSNEFKNPFETDFSKKEIKKKEIFEQKFNKSHESPPKKQENDLIFFDDTPIKPSNTEDSKKTCDEITQKAQKTNDIQCMLFFLRFSKFNIF